MAALHEQLNFSNKQSIVATTRIILYFSNVANHPDNGKTKGSGNGSPLQAKPTHETVTFHYIKGPDFRTIHIDGAIGGITPSGFLHIAMYCERAAIPKKIVQKLLPDGSLGPELERIGKLGVARQMEIDIIVNEATARNLKAWLDEQLENFKRRRTTEAIQQ